jgi:hypothetical protein
MKLGPFYEFAKGALQSLRVVEYLGPETGKFCFSSINARIKVQVYALYHIPRSLDDDKDFPEGEIIKMPHSMFDDQWDE